jgi:sodium-dependent dicarboxylate transporter 2/3/5
MGGFILAIAIEKWKLHMRIALSVIKLIGTNANGIIAGFLLATASLSMWMSNTATVVMMLPICASVISLVLKSNDCGAKLAKNYQNFAASLMLAIAYGSSIGGIATIIGTPTNTIFANYLKETHNYEVGFLSWSIVGCIFMLLMLVVAWLALIKLFPNNLHKLTAVEEIMHDEFKNLGKMSKGEKLVLTVFITTALLWSFRLFINKVFPDLNLKDESIAMFAAISLFLIPVDFKAGKFLMDWPSAEKLPWGILLLFGGGLSLANAIESCGLVNVLGQKLIGNMSSMTVFALPVFIVLLLTQFMSNMTLITIFLPVLSALSMAYNVHPLLIALPATIAASCAFCLPISTPPNAIVFASGHLSIAQMAKAGIVISLVSFLLIMLIAIYVVPLVFNI